MHILICIHSTGPNAGFTFRAFNTVRYPFFSCELLRITIDMFISLTEKTEALLSEEAIAFWTSFVSSGNPSTSRKSYSPVWSNFATGRRMVLTESSNSSGTASGTEITPADEITRCKFWMSLNVTAQTEV